MPTDYLKLPHKVQAALDNLDIEDSDPLSPEQVFEKYCEWHGIIGWDLYNVAMACKAAEKPPLWLCKIRADKDHEVIAANEPDAWHQLIIAGKVNGNEARSCEFRAIPQAGAKRRVLS